MPTVPELKEQLTHLGVDWKQGMRKDELEKMVEDNTPTEEVVSEVGDSDISDAPDVDEAPGYIGTAEIKSQVSDNATSDGSDFIDPNWGDK